MPPFRRISERLRAFYRPVSKRGVQRNGPYVLSAASHTGCPFHICDTTTQVYSSEPHMGHAFFIGEYTCEGLAAQHFIYTGGITINPASPPATPSSCSSVRGLFSAFSGIIFLFSFMAGTPFNPAPGVLSQPPSCSSQLAPQQGQGLPYFMYL